MPVYSYTIDWCRHSEFNTMKATAELQVIPVGSGVSVRAEVKQIVELLQDSDFILETHAAGTNIEGELADILTAVGRVHEAMHARGSVRLVSYLKLETRTDKTPTLAGKRL
jgi:uncharacterized protein (TIGR00106 family)